MTSIRRFDRRLDHRHWGYYSIVFPIDVDVDDDVVDADAADSVHFPTAMTVADNIAVADYDYDLTSYQ